MILETVTIADAQPAVTHKRASQTFTITETKGLRVQTGPPIVDELEAVCPAGKKWRAVVTVDVYEEDAE